MNPLDGVRVVDASTGPDVGTGVARLILRGLGADVVAGGVGEVADAHVVLLSGPEQRGLSYVELKRDRPDLVVARIAPSVNALGPMPDEEVIVHARAGTMTQIRAHEPGRPAFPDLAIARTGAGLGITVGALALLYEGRGGWAETSLYDGIFALLPMIVGRAERPSPTTELLWRRQGPEESLAYRCADGGWIQLWFGAKGAYESFLEHVGDEPSEQGYNADLVSGAMVERGKRWSATFASQPRDFWLDDLAGNNFRAEPVWRPGEALRDPHVREVGLSVDEDGRTVLAPPVRVHRAGDGEPSGADGRLLEGVHVLDLSAYLAGPMTPLILAELGADVVKVEPPTGDVHRNMHPMFAAGQRGKRSVALDLKSEEAARALPELFRWADVVHHNSRVGLAERLGYDEAAVRAANPDAVYSFASGFGETGPRALLPTNDQLMQAIAGIEAGQGGRDAPPTFLVWGAVDVTGGWVAACGVLGGLVGRRRHGGGHRVSSSLLGAALTLKRDAHWEGDTLVEGDVLDGQQLGYGPDHRIEETADGWVAIAGEHREPVFTPDRQGFIDAFLDDPVNRQLGRVVSYEWGERGLLEQPAFPVRLGPEPRPEAPPHIPELGEHTAELLGS